MILRIWSSEAQLKRFRQQLDLVPGIEKPYTTLLISSMETWYQRAIEAKPNWFREIVPENFARSLKHSTIPKSLQYTAKVAKKTGRITRYFVFISNPPGKNKTLLNVLKARFSQRSDPLFNESSCISLYSCYNSSFSGVILKGQTSNFAKAAHNLVELALEEKENNRVTTTYICSDKLKPEANDLASGDKEPIEPRKPEIVYNLLISDGCNGETLAEDDTAKKASDHFVHQLVPFVQRLFHFHAEWWRQIKDIRYLYKWCVLKDNDQLEAYLMRHYAEIERTLRDAIQQRFTADQAVDQQHREGAFVRELVRKHRLPDTTALEIKHAAIQKLGLAEGRELTLGPLAVYLEKHAARKIGFSDPKLIQDFATALKACAKHRNELMHGSLTDLCETNSAQQTFKWDEPVMHFIRVAVLLPHVLPDLLKWATTSELANTTES